MRNTQIVYTVGFYVMFAFAGAALILFQLASEDAEARAAELESAVNAGVEATPPSTYTMEVTGYGMLARQAVHVSIIRSGQFGAYMFEFESRNTVCQNKFVAFCNLRHAVNVTRDGADCLHGTLQYENLTFEFWLCKTGNGNHHLLIRQLGRFGGDREYCNYDGKYYPL